MSNQFDFKRKFQELGGVSSHPICPDDRPSLEALELLERSLEVSFPSAFREFHLVVGSLSFNEPIEVECIEQPEFGSTSKFVTVDNFYSCNMSLDCSISKVFETYRDQLPPNHLPICDGPAGDLICFDTSETDKWNVRFWVHDWTSENKSYKISDSFEEFIMKLQKSNFQPTPSRDQAPKGAIKESPAFLEMLAKSGIKKRPK